MSPLLPLDPARRAATPPPTAADAAPPPFAPTRPTSLSDPEVRQRAAAVRAFGDNPVSNPHGTQLAKFAEQTQGLDADSQARLVAALQDVDPQAVQSMLQGSPVQRSAETAALDGAARDAVTDTVAAAYNRGLLKPHQVLDFLEANAMQAPGGSANTVPAARALDPTRQAERAQMRERLLDDTMLHAAERAARQLPTWGHSTAKAIALAADAGQHASIAQAFGRLSGADQQAVINGLAQVLATHRGSDVTLSGRDAPLTRLANALHQTYPAVVQHGLARGGNAEWARHAALALRESAAAGADTPADTQATASRAASAPAAGAATRGMRPEEGRYGSSLGNALGQGFAGSIRPGMDRSQSSDESAAESPRQVTAGIRAADWVAASGGWATAQSGSSFPQPQVVASGTDDKNLAWYRYDHGAEAHAVADPAIESYALPSDVQGTGLLARSPGPQEYAGGAAELLLGGFYNQAVRIGGGLASIPYAMFDGVDAAVAIQDAAQATLGYTPKSDGAADILGRLAPVASYVQDNVIKPIRAFSERHLGDGMATALGAALQASAEIYGAATGIRATGSFATAAWDDASLGPLSGSRAAQIGAIDLGDTGRVGATGRQFVTLDPGVGEIIAGIEARAPGAVKQAEINIYRPDGTTYTDFDIVTDTHVIQVKVGGGKGIVPQIQASQQLTGRPVIGFDANEIAGTGLSFKPSVMNSAQQNGITIVKNLDELMNILRPGGR